VDERGRAAAVEVDRALGAKLDHHLRELEHGEPAVDVRAPAVAGDCDERLPRHPEGGARVATVGDVRVELRGARGEALPVFAGVEDDLPAGDEQRPAWTRSPAGSAGAEPRSTSRTSPPSITMQPRCAAYGAATGSCRAGRPSIHSSPSGR
jgi:hypothetical protein